MDMDSNKQLIKKRIEELKLKAKQLNIRQHMLKIHLNSYYGYLGNGFASMFDQDIARSVTLTGQECIKNSDKIIQEFKFEGTDTRAKSLYCDTDSLYISLKPLVDEGVLKFWEEKGKTISKEFYDICDNIIENYLNDGIKKWGETALNSKDCRFQFKRESICDAGLWLQKKRYILNVMDMEGVPTDNKIKVTGYDTQSSAVPKIVKPYLFEMLRTIFSDKTKSGCNLKYKDIYDRFKALNYVDVAFPKSLNDLKKYEENCKGFQTVKGMPCHVKSAYFHNLLIDELKLENKYKKFVNGDKVRYIYVCKNKYGIEAIAFKDKYPTEFEEIFEVDWEKMFEKIVEKSIERLYNAMDWELDKSMLNSACDLMSLLG